MSLMYVFKNLHISWNTSWGIMKNIKMMIIQRGWWVAKWHLSSLKYVYINWNCVWPLHTPIIYWWIFVTSKRWLCKNVDIAPPFDNWDMSEWIIGHVWRVNPIEAIDWCSFIYIAIELCSSPWPSMELSMDPLI